MALAAGHGSVDLGGNGTGTGTGTAVPSAADLEAYDALLAGASRVTFHLDKKNLKEVAEAYRQGFRVESRLRADVDGVRGAFYIITGDSHSDNVNSPQYRVAPMYSDIVLGDGSDGHVVQTITCKYGNDGAENAHWKQVSREVTSQSMDRGDTLRIKYDLPEGSCTLGEVEHPFCRCHLQKRSITVEREATTEIAQNSPPVSAPPTGIQLVRTPEANKAGCCYMWTCCVCCGVPTCCFAPLLLYCFCPVPSDKYIIQDDTGAPLGGGRYLKRYPTVWEGGCDRFGAELDLGSAPLAARRLAVAPVANHRMAEAVQTKLKQSEY